MHKIIKLALAAACLCAQPQVNWEAVGDQINPYHPTHENHCTNGHGNDPNTPACQGPHDANTPEPATWMLSGGALLALMALRAHRQHRR